MAELTKSLKRCQTCALLMQTILTCVPRNIYSRYGYLVRSISLGPGHLQWVEDVATEKGLGMELEAYNRPCTGGISKLHERSIPSGYTGSDEAFERAKYWIKECTTHADCGGGLPTTLPARVLDLGENDSSIIVKLHITGKETSELARYACLSHCWGGHLNPTILTKSNMNSWVQGFPSADLPILYQQAIITTKLLGIRYLWIDSICIIQDDNEDWQRESAKMAEIYQNSFVTIAASCSGNEDEEMFSLTSKTYSQIKIKLHPRYGDHKTFICRRSLPNHENWFEYWHPSTFKPDLPLLSRAWIYQERLLAPRVLHYTKEELILECLAESRCECGYHEQYEKSMKAEHASLLFEITPKPNDANKYLGSDSRSTIHRDSRKMVQRWMKIVNEYSALKLSFEKDKFPALSGIAKQIMAATDDEYLAGTWRSELLQCLCWYNADENPGSQIKEWRAPSWSWAAINGRIAFFAAPPEAYRNAGIIPGLEKLAQLHMDQEKRTLKILRAEVVPIGADLTGEVTSGFIEAQGLYGTAIIRHNLPDLSAPSTQYTVFLEGDKFGKNTIVPGSLLLDYELSPSDQLQHVAFLSIGKNQNTDVEAYFVLKSLESKLQDMHELYERIGIFQSIDCSSVMNLVEKTIRVI